MKLVRSAVIDDASLISSNVPETVSAYSGTAVYVLGGQARSADRVYESKVGESLGTATMTIASPCVVTRNGHGLAAGAPICFTTTGALPTGLVAGTIYYVMAAGLTANAFQLAATASGAAINTSGSQSGTHTLISNPNVGKAVGDTDYWIDIGPTNRMAMFDTVNGTRTAGVPTIETVTQPAGRIDCIALLNVDATSIHVTISDAIDGVFFDEDFNMVSNSGILDIHAYYYEPVVRKADLIITGLTPYVSPTIEITITKDGGSSQVGTFITGQVRTMGATLISPQVGLKDYSLIEVDDFGDYTLIPRDYSLTGNYRVSVANGFFDEFVRLMGGCLGRATLFIMSEKFAAMAMFGIVRECTLEVPYPETSLCSLNLERLT